MEIDVVDTVSQVTESKKDRLNTLVAITIALLATFTGICKVKDDNIVQAMQQAQADRIDHWSWYQSLHTREEGILDQLTLLKLQKSTADTLHQPAYDATIKAPEEKLTHVTKHKEEVSGQAKADQQA